jgi:predicted RNase H-like HicB family nuclease
MHDSSHYPVVVFWSEEDRAFIAEVPDLPGCLADGATQTEALQNVAVIIQEWIETAQELGRPIPAPRQRLQIAA